MQLVANERAISGGKLKAAVVDVFVRTGNCILTLPISPKNIHTKRYIYKMQTVLFLVSTVISSTAYKWQSYFKNMFFKRKRGTRYAGIEKETKIRVRYNRMSRKNRFLDDIFSVR